MKPKQPNQYRPDVVSHPGETLLEAMETRGMTRAALAAHLGLSVDALNALIAGAENISRQDAEGLEQALGIARDFWLARAQRYRESRRR